MKTKSLFRRSGIFTILTFALFLMHFALYSQSPQGFNYQAVVRDASGQIVKEQAVSLRLTLLQGSEGGTVVYSETHQVTTSAVGLISVVVGEGTAESGDFSAIDWENGPYYLKVEMDLSGGSNYETLGVSALMSVPYALQAGTVGSLTRLEVQGDDPDTEDALFEVKRKDGQTVFAVYNEGVRIYVDTTGTAKGPRRSGFAIGGFGMTKDIGQEYLRVTPDSVRIYINDTDKKGPRGGFAIGGYDFGKGITREYLRVTDDSTRVYVNNFSKGLRGGFAIGGYDFGKGRGVTDYFNVDPGSSIGVIDPSQPRILWYPQKEAFMTGRVLVESPDSVGTNSLATGFESKAVGDYSQALGFRTIARGNYSLAMGDSAVTNGDNSLAMGYKSYAGGMNAFSFGNGALALGDGCYAFGSYKVDTTGFLDRSAPTVAAGTYSVAIGQGAGTSDGYANFAFGPGAKASGERYSIAIGHTAVASGKEAISLGSFGTYSVPPFMMLYLSPNIASGYRSMALGFANHADSAYSVCLGTANWGLGYYGTAIGYRNKVYGWHAIGAGQDLDVRAYNSFVVGALNEPEGDSTRWVETDPLFVVGNGYRSYTSTIRQNAFVVYKSGNAYFQDSVGIGTKRPRAQLQVSSSGDMGEIMVSASAVNQSSQLFLSEDPTGNYGMRIMYDGDNDQLKILGKRNSTTYGPWLLINRNDGEVRMPQVFGDAVGSTYQNLYIDNSGKIGYLSSSRRYKKSIRTMENPEWLYQLHPVNFVYKSDKEGQKQYGLIAEEVEKVNPLFVSYNEKGQVETVAYNKLITPMLKALQEQKARIDKLEKENAALQASLEKIKREKNELAGLKKEVDELKQILGAMTEK